MTIYIESEEEYTELFSLACDAAFRVIEDKFFDRRDWTDVCRHTSAESRAMSHAIFEAIGLQSLESSGNSFIPPGT